MISSKLPLAPVRSNTLWRQPPDFKCGHLSMSHSVMQILVPIPPKPSPSFLVYAESASGVVLSHTPFQGEFYPYADTHRIAARGLVLCYESAFVVLGSDYPTCLYFPRRNQILALDPPYSALKIRFGGGSGHTARHPIPLLTSSTAIITLTSGKAHCITIGHPSSLHGE